ncbi:amidohydrolase family protein [Flavihumibacter solisilvae]|uniref:Amidohydrolase n=1 Tax=Flavihumibacter solisilvae TaxID=1349421 RepID=A0A0C1L884_9BACT|nr:amidohydrolase family protein [Flavihumibacter solisilvae]KIC95821.1 amidohydrolase [Flavihumibacter solisilvae]
MRNLIVLLLLVFFSACYSQDSENLDKPVDSRQREIVFLSVNVIPIDKEQVLADQTVVVRDGKIVEMGKTGKVKYNREALLIEAKGKYLIPGLAEMHAHVPPVNDLEPMKDVLLLFATHGITTIRGMLGHPRHLELRNMLEKEEILGPRFYTSGPSFNGNSIKSTAAADSLVRQQKQAGYDFLKLHPGLSRENFDAMVKTAREVNITFAGHVSFDVGVWHAIESGYATIDHLDGFVEGLVPSIQQMNEQEVGIFGMNVSDKSDPAQIPKLVDALKSHHIWVVPTQALAERWFSPWRDANSFRQDPAMKYMPAATLTNWVNSKNNLVSNAAYDSAKADAFIRFRRRLILECHKGGVGILLGSDAPQVFNVPGISTHQELQYLVESGLTPYQALRTGTFNVAEFYGAKDRGVIKKGAVAELVLLKGNPIENISNTQTIEGVMLVNKWLPRKYLDSTLKKLEKN